eukprot:scaffold2397_cov336-Prasinococcus_capsulatus_cf.AAC.1
MEEGEEGERGHGAQRRRVAAEDGAEDAVEGSEAGAAAYDAVRGAQHPAAAARPPPAASPVSFTVKRARIAVATGSSAAKVMMLSAMATSMEVRPGGAPAGEADDDHGDEGLADEAEQEQEEAEARMGERGIAAAESGDFVAAVRFFRRALRCGSGGRV